MADSGSGEKITITRRRAIEGLVQGKTIAEASQISGVSERSIYRFLNDQDFMLALHQAEDRVQDQITRRLINRTMKNIEILESIADNPNSNDNARIRAIEAMTDTMFKIYDMRNTQTRLTELEEAIQYVKFRT